MFQLAVAHPISSSLGKVNGEIDGDKEQNFRENTSSPSAVLGPIFLATLIPKVVGSGRQEIARPHPRQFQPSSIAVSWRSLGRLKSLVSHVQYGTVSLQ